MDNESTKPQNTNNDLSCMSHAWSSSEKNGGNIEYLESLYETYLNNPEELDQTWIEYFDNINQDNITDTIHTQIKEQFENIDFNKPQAQNINQNSQSCSFENASKHEAVMDLIYSYRAYGHSKAKLDPLKLKKRTFNASLTLEHHGLDQSDLEQEFHIKDMNYANKVKLKNIINDLEEIYCDQVGCEYMHITNHDERVWIKDRLEKKQVIRKQNLDANKKKWLLQRLIAADIFEKYLAARYVGQKRFGLEGCDPLIPLLNEIIEQASDNNINSITMSMAHRGRLNGLINVAGKEPKILYQEFEGTKTTDLIQGDVKYHLGFASNLKIKDKVTHLAVAFNPSHLEIVAPVLEGATRARQDKRDGNPNSGMALHTLGDSSIAGQGVVMEALNMSQTRGFFTGGSMHIVINNQVGFTTSDPRDTRSTMYCTDIAKMMESPIFHVNINDPEALISIAKLAVEFRVKFNKDVFIDLVGFRALGHNEADEPAATQPLMYSVIRKTKPSRVYYEQKLIAEGIITKEEADKMVKSYRKDIEAGKSVVDLAPASDPRTKEFKKFETKWKKYLDTKWTEPYNSKMPLKKLQNIAKKLEVTPEGFTFQKQVGKIYEDRKKMTQGERPINWGYAEVLAYATLAESGVNIRFSGEDIQRGTFAHRHAAVHDFKTGEVYTPLNNLGDKQGKVDLYNSLLSEEGVLGFEYGYASASPDNLVIWEAQFGDFANGAQVIFDQFLSAGEEKWGRLSNLCVFLPHGNEGMGPEHSSARLERCLQLCANDNMQVCVPSTPAQDYHMIRRQMLRDFRKPLIVMTPKSLLRHPLAVSSLDDLSNGEFQNVIDEIDDISKNKVERILLCAGKVYYELLQARRDKKIKNIAIIRIEQLYPFPDKDLKAILKKYNAKEIIWCQEEPENQGAFLMIQKYIQSCMPKGITIKLISKDRFASPAAGTKELFSKRQKKLINDALKIK